ncbi:hypothetical protein BDK51DRAFT_32896 [Blyttiomyces helicus]|uniref:Dynamin GTPase domain-containing protein n=1 Tax=Blyttiomyces helicus TaxID=388810 RepID=A0A4P9W0C4_9FUNG|nr:hypothetical protein BDK51DRAFT_32896 [Blyttiomyces helicus]|eukprot:RKO84543.1 hypothetical protein BDK51DRAFT_32896 [Blyttiomyces helicus]
MTEIRIIRGSAFSARAGRRDAKQVSSVDEIAAVIDERIKDLEAKKSAADIVIVEVTAPDILDLIVVDVPGVDEVEGGVQVALLLENPNVMIPAVTPMTQDVSTRSSTFRRIQKIDPAGKRTIGVLTKPDLLSETWARSILLSGVDTFPLGCGIILSRSQTDIDEDVGIDEVKDRERAFFSANPHLINSYVFVGADDLLGLLSRVGAELRMISEVTEDTQLYYTPAELAVGPAPAKSVRKTRGVLTKAWEAYGFNERYFAELDETINASFESRATKAAALDAILDELGSTYPDPPSGIKSTQAEADYLASMIEAYWHISSSRVVDNIIGYVTKLLVRGFPTQLDLKV